MIYSVYGISDTYAGQQGSNSVYNSKLMPGTQALGLFFTAVTSSLLPIFGSFILLKPSYFQLIYELEVLPLTKTTRTAAYLTFSLVFL